MFMKEEKWQLRFHIPKISHKAHEYTYSILGLCEVTTLIHQSSCLFWRKKWLLWIMWQSMMYKKYLPTLMTPPWMTPIAANFFNLVIDLWSGVNLLREFLGKSYWERSVWVGVFGKGFFGKGFFRKLYHTDSGS